MQNTIEFGIDILFRKIW